MIEILEQVKSNLREDGNPNVLFTKETRPAAMAQLKAGIQAPFVAVGPAPISGPQIALFVSLQPREQWKNGIRENSAYFQMFIDEDGTMDMFTWVARGLKMRRSRAKTIDDAIFSINRFIAIVKSAAPQGWDGGGMSLSDHLRTSEVS